MKYETMNRLNEELIKENGSAEAYIILRRLDEDLAEKIDALYEADYDAAPEEDHSNDNIFEIAMNPNYVMSKAQVINAWAHNIIEGLRTTYLHKLGEDGLKALSKIACLDGEIYATLKIAQGVEIPLKHTDNYDYIA